jgi:heat shock protein HslJ
MEGIKMDSKKSIGILVFLLLTSCAVKKNSSSKQDNNFTGGKWIITEMMEMAVDSTKSGNQFPHIVFNLQDFKMSIYAGCNQMSSSFSIHADTLVTQQMISTRMACTDMEYEVALERLLAPGNFTFVEEKNSLDIFHNGSKMLHCIRP